MTVTGNRPTTAFDDDPQSQADWRCSRCADRPPSLARSRRVGGVR